MAAYVRVSTEEQAQSGYSVAAQIEKLEAMCKSQDWKMLPVYVDDAYSGKNLDRPAMRRLLEDARRKKFDVVLVYKLDRLSRRLSDLVSLGEKFESIGIGLRSLTEPFDTTYPAGKLLFNMLGSFAQFERELIGERTKLALQRRLREGKWNGIAPFGYRLGKEGPLEVHPEEMPYAKRVFQIFLEEGLGVKLIARRMLKEDRCTRRKGKWARTTVWHMLANPAYAGLVTLDGELQEAKHRPLISRQQFDEVQRRLKSNALTPSEQMHSPNILMGLLKCGRCGRQMTTAKGQRTYYYYACCGRVDGGTCDLDYIAARPFEQAVIGKIREIATHPEMIEQYLTQFKAQNMEVTTRLRAERAALRNRIEGLKRKKDSKVRWLAEALPQKSITEEVAGEIQKQLDETGTLEGKTLDLDRQIERLSEETARADAIAQFLRTFLDDFESFPIPQKRRTMRYLVKQVIVTGKEAAKVVFTLPLTALPKAKKEPKRAPFSVGEAPRKVPLHLLPQKGVLYPLGPKCLP